MQSLVSRIEKTVLRPQPILKFTTGRLISEIGRLERLLEQAAAANRAGYEELYAEQNAALRAAASRGEDLASVKVPRLFSVKHDYVVRDQLRDLLALRLQLCRSELSRRRRARNRNARR